jgi:hypothetical protein
MNIPIPISFGLNIRKPQELQTRTTGEVLESIHDGEWREQILNLRTMPQDSKQQHEAKKRLPFVTWSGVFRRRANDGLENHAGQIGIDLDDLSAADCTKAVQDAVADPFCLAAFKSARAGGVRLLFRIPPCNAEEHDSAFEQVAEHVRNVYGHEPDTSARDVSRASFVSFDEGLWCYPNAQVLPVILDLAHSDGCFGSCCEAHRCVPSATYSVESARTLWGRMGSFHVGDAVKQDGSVFTHVKLLDLGKAMALHAKRINHTLTGRDYDEAVRSWLTEHQRKGLRLRGDFVEYRAELRTSVEGARRKRWFTASAEKWTRWTRHPDFPDRPEERLLFAIRKHCEDAGSPDFFIGARDAGLLCGVSFRTGARLLGRLVGNRKLQLLTVPGEHLPFHAYEYRLVNSGASPVSDRATVAVVIDLNLVLEVPLSTKLEALRR